MEQLEERINLACAVGQSELYLEPAPAPPTCAFLVDYFDGQLNVFLIDDSGEVPFVPINVGSSSQDGPSELVINEGRTWDRITRTPVLTGNVRTLIVGGTFVNLSAMSAETFPILESTFIGAPPTLKPNSDGYFDTHIIGSFSNDRIEIQKVNDNLPWYFDILGGAGDDLITSQLNLRDLSGTVSGGAGFDTLLITDLEGTEEDPVANNVTVTGEGNGFSVTSGGGSLRFSSFDQTRIDLGPGDDSINIQGMQSLEGTLGMEVLGNIGIDNLNASGAGEFSLRLDTGADVTPQLSRQEVALGGSGNDLIIGGNNRDLLKGGPGNDRLLGGEEDDELHGEAGFDRLFGDDGNDHLFGGDDSDRLYDGDGDDEARGGSGDDLFGLGTGFDLLFGEGGSDRFEVSEMDLVGDSTHSPDVVDGGADNDGFLFTGGDVHHSYSLDDSEDGKTLVFSLDENPIVAMTEIEGVYLQGGAEADSFSILPFVDDTDFDVNGGLIKPVIFPKPVVILHGGNGDGTYYLTDADVQYLEALLVLGGDNTDDVFGSSFGEVIVAGKGNDTIAAGDGDNLVLGMDGIDTITGGMGADHFIGGAGGDTLRGGKGSDWLLDQFPGMWNVVRSRLPEWILPIFDDKASLYLNDIEIQLKAEGGANDFRGEDGNDVILGGTGADFQLDGGNDFDVIFGEGFEINASFALNAAFFANYFKAIAAFSFKATIGIDPLPGGNDTIFGGDGFDIILGGNGNDTIDAGKGSSIVFGDSIKIEGPQAEFTVAASANAEGQNDAVATENFNLIPTIKLAGSGNDTINAGNGDRPTFNIVLGGDGNDILLGGDAYVDFLFGNRGDDIQIDGGLVQGVETGIDVLVGGEGNDNRLAGGNFANLILGDSFNLDGFSNLNLESLRNGKFNIGLALTPLGNGNDTLIGGSGFDVLVGGSGNDYIEGGDGLNIAFGDAFSWSIAVGFDVEGKFSGATETEANQKQSAIGDEPTEMFDLLHSTFRLEGTGQDTYVGGSGIDVVFGGDGKDHIRGEGGWDFLVGGGEDDVVDGGPGATFTLDKARQVVFGGPGNDQLIGGDDPDWLESEQGNDIFHGRGGDDIIYAGADADELYGEDGNDQLFGEAGADLLVGGNGDDVLTGGPDLDTFDGGLGNNTIVDPEGVASIGLSRSKVFAGLTSAWVANLTIPLPEQTLSFGLSDSRFEVRNAQLYLRAGNSIVASTGSFLPLTITASAGATVVATGTFSLLVEAAPSTWDFAYQWRPKPLDVDIDGLITPLDALLIINRLNASPIGTLTPQPGGTQAPNFYDTSGDNVIAPLDALLVINFLNAGGGSEGESTLNDAANLSWPTSVEANSVNLPPESAMAWMWWNSLDIDKQRPKL